MSFDPMVATGVVTLIVISALLQRITGLGFAMITAPFMVVLLGPHAGVMLTNILGLIAPAIMMFFIWRDIQWRRLLYIAPAALVVMPACGWLAAMSPQGPLYMVVAGLVIFGLSTSLLLSRHIPQIDGPTTRMLTGVGAGAGVVFAGVGGPAMTIYGVISRWDMRAFAATLQPLWILLSIGAFSTKISFSSEEIPLFPWWFWALCLAGIVLGLVCGSLLREKVSEPLVRRLMTLLAIAGAVLAFATGVHTTFF